MIRAAENLPQATYIDLVRTLFATLTTTIIMAASFVGVSALVIDQVRHPALIALASLGMLAAAARIAVLLLYRRTAEEDGLDFDTARRLERWFAIPYLSFAVIFGAFAAFSVLVVHADVRTLIIGLLFGYSAGVAAGLAMRPWISVTAVLAAVVPTIVASAFGRDINLWATGALLAIFLFGGVQNILNRYRAVVSKTNMHRLFVTLARQDHLTGLPNRLSLRERFESAGRTSAGSLMAVHCLDLDRFKPVNDQFGHPVGDLLLKAVSDRLVGLLRRDDFAARMGGDEFIVVQAGIAHADEADMLARRIVRAIAQPYSIQGHEVVIGTSVGFVLSPEFGTDLDKLVACADEALYEVKRSGGGVGAYRGPKPQFEARDRLSRA